MNAPSLFSAPLVSRKHRLVIKRELQGLGSRHAHAGKLIMLFAESGVLYCILWVRRGYSINIAQVLLSHRQ